MLAVAWGPVAVWAGAVATFCAALIALVAGAGYLDRLRAPHLLVTFEHAEPWCRSVDHPDEGDAFWVRVGVENVGRGPARGCIGRLTSLRTNGMLRTDVDPVQLRWAGVPRSRSFEPVDLRRGQREFLNVVYLVEGSRWRIDTYSEPDFDPGFTTELPADGEHVVDLALFADNAATAAFSLEISSREPGLKLRTQK
jgi:hypothetical protein